MTTEQHGSKPRIVSDSLGKYIETPDGLVGPFDDRMLAQKLAESGRGDDLARGLDHPDSIIHELGGLPASPSHVPPPQGNGEAVAWQYRAKRSAPECWSEWRDVDSAGAHWRQAYPNEFEVRPLFAAPPSQSEGVRGALEAAIEFIADEYKTRDYEDQSEWLPPTARAVHAKLIAALYGHSGTTPSRGLVEAAEDLVNFAWSAVTADCEEARVNLNLKVNQLREALRTLSANAADREGDRDA